VVGRFGLVDTVTRGVDGRAVARAVVCAVVGVGAVVVVGLLLVLVLGPAPVAAAVVAGRLEQAVSSSATVVRTAAGATAYLRGAVLIARNAGSRAWPTTRPSSCPGR
jgi:hypothetical protein